MSTRWIVRIVGTVVIVAVVVTGGAIGYRELFGPTHFTAIFTTATAIYPGDDVRVAGVKVGHIRSITPRGTTTEMVLAVDRDIRVPADARAVIVAQSLVAARYVQLTPAYRTSGPTLADGAVIPVERTAVPVEWDEIKAQLTKLATGLGPDGGAAGSSMGRFVDSTAAALSDGNGEKLRQMLAQLSAVGRILADGSGNIVDILQNLQTFVDALKGSGTEIVRFENRLATLSSVVDDSTSDLDAALRELSVAVGEVQRFVSENRAKAGEQVQRLANVTQNLVDHRADLENLLHIAPNSIANFYHIYNPDTGTEAGVFELNNFSNPMQFICAGVASIENATAAESGEKCRQYLGPILPLLSFNYLPFPVSPATGPAPDPNNVIYSEPDLVPKIVGQQPGPSAPTSVTELLQPWGRPPS
ncbi:MCE family protein [Nocardia violaceofusca]|uniref:MCE family protein n=1 Tax=Nocardia violaceofusca TaxID=941182 RepID=UPI000A071BA2|nr:MCE family protein [Nocardia violaceofusca]